MVKRKFLILLLIVSLVSMSFGLTPRVIDGLELLGAEEIEQIETFMESLEEVFDIETAAFFLEDDKAVDSIADDYNFTNPRKVIFAYSDESSSYKIFTDGIDELDDDSLGEILEELVDEGHTQALALLNSFYYKVYERLLPSLGGAMADIFDDIDEDFEEDLEVEDEDEDQDYDDEDLYGQLALVFQDADFWTEEQEEKLQAKAEKIAQDHDIFIALVFMDEDLEMGASDYIDAVLDEFTDNKDSVGLAVDFESGSIGIAAGGKVEDILEEDNKDRIFNSVNDAFEEGDDYQAALNFLNELEAFFQSETKAPLEAGQVLESKLVYIEDAASLWTPEERQKLFDKAQELGEEYELFVVMATTDDAQGKLTRDYLFDLAEEQFGVDTDKIEFLIDMENREVFIASSGDYARDVIKESQVDKLLDLAFDKLVDGDYYGAADSFLNQSSKYFKKAGPNKISSTDAAAGLGLGGATGFGFFRRNKKKYEKKAKPKNFQYINNLVGGITPARGTLLNKRTTSRRIPSSSGGGGSSGGSGTHTSSSGGTHTGGGRKF